MLTTMFSSASGTWSTPRATFDALHAEFAFTVDACAAPDTACLPRYWTETDDALLRTWRGERVYMNPPYGRELPRWIYKAWNEKGHAEVIACLIPARPDTAYWHDWIFGHAEIRFLRGRLRFGDAKNGAPFPSAVVVYRG